MIKPTKPTKSCIMCNRPIATAYPLRVSSTIEISMCRGHGVSAQPPAGTVIEDYELYDGMVFFAADNYKKANSSNCHVCNATFKYGMMKHIKLYKPRAITKREVFCQACYEYIKQATDHNDYGNCSHCNIEVKGKVPERSYLYCSTACQQASLRKRRRDEKGFTHHERVCFACGDDFISRRNDAVTCSPKCRMTLSRSEELKTDLLVWQKSL